jgi:hypothetical protein
MTYLALCLLCILTVELFLFFPVLKPVVNLAEVSQKSLRVLSSTRISDHWKEKALKYYARDMARYSLTTAFWLALLFFIVALSAYLIDMLMDGSASVIEFAMSLEGMVLATFIALIYLYIRKKIVPA